MQTLPDAREDGRCVDCEKRQAVTTDKRFCLDCLRVRVNEANSGLSVVREQLGRNSISCDAIGGQAEANSEDDDG